jgi:hypothetical protein
VLAHHWDVLANYESYELIERDLNSRHGPVPDNWNAREIAARFVHARSYFRAATIAEHTVKPLLLYYGVFSLARGLTLLLRGEQESDLVPHHGLRAKNWQQILRKSSPDFGDLVVAIENKGAFTELSQATKCVSLLRSGSPTANFKYSHVHIQDKFEFSLNDILARLPKVRNQYELWKDNLLCARCEINRMNDGTKQIIFNRRNEYRFNLDIANTICAGTSFRFNCENNSAIIFHGTSAPDPGLYLSDKTYRQSLDIGDIWVVKSLEHNRQMSNICIIFVLAYILGMVARYHPTEWTGLVRGQIRDAALPTLMAVMDTVENDFPMLTLDFLARSDQLPNLEI